MTSTRRLAVVALTAAVMLTSAACDGDPNEPGTSTSTSSQDVTSSETPATEDPTTESTSGPPELDPPEPPEGMDVDDHQGAALAAGYFLELYNYMRATGDTGRFEAMSSSECNFCATAIDIVETTYGAGDWMEGGNLTFDVDVADVVLPTDDQPAYTVQLEAEQAPVTIHRRDGTSESADGGGIKLALGTQVIDERFIVLGVNVEEA